MAIDAVEIPWPDAKIERRKSFAADCIDMIADGQGVKDKKPLPPPGPGGARFRLRRWKNAFRNRAVERKEFSAWD